MNFVLLQENLEELVKNPSKGDFVFNFLKAYGIPKSTITLLKKNPTKTSNKENQVILKNKVFYHTILAGEDVHFVIDNLQKDANTHKYNPRFIIVTDFRLFLAVDTKTNETLDISFDDLAKHYAFFLPWAGMEKTQHISENPADIRAASKMAKLYDQIIKDCPEYSRKHVDDLNIFLSRLLFCYFSEDTGIFSEGLFTKSISSHTEENGRGLSDYFHHLFDVLNTPINKRTSFAHHFTLFPYVNGGLFEKKIELPDFTRGSRDLIIQCGKLSWETINPDIFGSMIQVVANPNQRENLGMHYTSVPNIMKVIEPLFLDELKDEFKNADGDIKKLNKLRERISKIKVFDPACGSGNFLIISYKKLCELEVEILKHVRLSGGSSFASLEGWNYSESSISLNNFFGIEIDNFAHEIAKLSLYLAQHQVNLLFEKEFGKLKPILPLKESGKIIWGNSIRLDWNEVCPRVDYKGENNEIYVAGNPPFEGSRKQEESQKEDLKSLFLDGYKSLDYVSAWFYKGAEYISGRTDIKLAFVSTNSISQGEQVALLWPIVFSKDVQISFAYQSFKWKNLAKGNAGVTCVIIGLSTPNGEIKRLYGDSGYINVKNINPYLASGDNVFIYRRSTPLSKGLPEMSFGNMPNDGGHLLMDQHDYSQIILQFPNSKKLIKKVTGSNEFIKGISRFCIWINDEDLKLAQSIPPIEKRIELVKEHRLSSKDKGTNRLAQRPHQFRDRRVAKKISIIIPSVSSERRRYIPIGFIDSDTIITNSAQVIYDPEPYIFGILNSQIHMVWVRAVSGRLKTDLRYSAEISYNTFPFPEITSEQKESITNHVYNVIEEREKFPDKTMAELYDPDKMPDGLREAHKYLDTAIDQIYQSKPFKNDEERLSHLFGLYEKMIAEENKK